MPGKDVVRKLTGSELVFLDTTRSNCLSLSFSGATGGSVNVLKKIPDGELINITDDSGVPLAISIFPTTTNIEVGLGCEVFIQGNAIVGTLVVTALPIQVR